ncbi:C40 family peptidase [Actinobaculum suis]|uniref:C40 family peptidase n=2 Tax=Actinobaculum suis TaxID=1657 RepID=UPI001C40055E|nr:transglycosylase SLT domain-containing protein [Actinobaculum suis]
MTSIVVALFIIFSPVLVVVSLFASLMGSLIDFGGSDDSATLLSGGVSNVPAQYQEIVLRAGSICPEITPPIIAAQIEAESGWNPDATSPVGARGIAQFMPATWASSGMDGDGDGKADIDNPIDAIWSQGNLMCSHVSTISRVAQSGEVKGDIVDLALAAYNAGLGRIWSFGGVPPFAETQNYIKKIRRLAEEKYASANVVAGGSGSGQVVTWALQQLGRPYRGEGPGGIDCCTFVRDAYKAGAGIDLPMSTPGAAWSVAKCEYAMYSRYAEYGGVQVPATLETLSPGDIMFFQSTSVSARYDNVTHVAIYIGGGERVESIPGQGIVRKPWDWTQKTDPMLPYAVHVPGAAG